MSAVPDPRHWPRRQLAASALRVGAALTPAVIALTVSWGMAVLLPPGPNVGTRVLWTVATIALAITAGALAARVMRRTAPLAWLLKLDVAFPDEAPSRFVLALQAGRTAELAADLRDHRIDGDDRDAAERIVSLAAALTAHDRATRGHSERVRGYTRLIGESMGIAAEGLDKLAWAGLLHDVGKLAIDPDVLNKRCRLDDDEMVEMRRHPIEGARLAAPLMPWLGEWGHAIAHHHERWDGSGYPAGLSGRQISLGGRIVAVADAFEAMTAQRPYNSPRTLHEARQELVDSASSHFDPAVVRALLAVPLGRLSRLALPSIALGVLPSLYDTVLGLGGQLQRAPMTVRHASASVAAAAVVTTAAFVPGGLPPSWTPYGDSNPIGGDGLTTAIISEGLVAGASMLPGTIVTPTPPAGDGLVDRPWEPGAVDDADVVAATTNDRPPGPPAIPAATHTRPAATTDPPPGDPPTDTPAPAPAPPPEEQPDAEPDAETGPPAAQPGPHDPVIDEIDAVVADVEDTAPLAGPVVGEAAGVVGEAAGGVLDAVLPAAPPVDPPPPPPAAPQPPPAAPPPSAAAPVAPTGGAAGGVADALTGVLDDVLDDVLDVLGIGPGGR